MILDFIEKEFYDFKYLSIYANFFFYIFNIFFIIKKCYFYKM